LTAAVDLNLLSVVAMTFAHPSLLWWLLAATLLIEMCALFWIPAKEASVPNLVRKDQLESANQVWGAERFIRTLKKQLLWVRTFDTVEELRLALLEFKARYNRAWLCERHGPQTPAQVRARRLERAA
jgi:hypothetical protein